MFTRNANENVRNTVQACAFGVVVQDGKQVTLHLLAFASSDAHTLDKCKHSASQGQASENFYFFLRLAYSRVFNVYTHLHLRMQLRIHRTCKPENL